MTNFDRVARLYRWAEYLTLGPLLQRTRNHFLQQLTHSKNALVLGDGDGRFLSKLLTQNPSLEATAVDTSAQMLQLLRTRCNTSRLQTIHTNALTYTPDPDTDLIVTHFFLDCFTQQEINTLAQNLAAAVAPGTLWLLSDFRVPDNPLRPIARVYIRSLYFVFRILTGLRITQLPNPAIALTTAGFQRIAHHQKLAGILYTELWQRNSKPTTHNGTSPQTSLPRTSNLNKTTLSRITHPLQSINSLQAQPQTNRSHPSKETMDDLTKSRPAPHPLDDALPDPEPAAPSLPEPDPGVYHHEPASRDKDQK